MLYKPRTKSAELQVLELLNTRMDFSDKERHLYSNLTKGYEGEIMFDLLTEKLQCDCLILNDLLLEINNTMFQIDSLMITSDKVYFYEVKNYEGDYYYESDIIYKKPQLEINNPLIQLSRSESLLRRLLNNLGSNLPIQASIVFINPEFTLYQAPLNKPFIFPNQIHHYLSKLNTVPSRHNEKSKILADQLISCHIKESPFTHLPPYDFDQLRKGIACEKCHSFAISIEGRKCICKKCGHEEMISTAVMRNVNELKLLFPNKKITTNLVYEWCKNVKSKKYIRRILQKNFKKVGVHQWSFYEEK